MALKQQIVDDVRSCVEKYKSIYVFSIKNMRNVKMKEVRIDWKPSRFFFGKNKVIAIALGKSSEDELGDDLHKLSACLKGQCGMLFTDKTKKEVIKWFENFSDEDYARSGFKAKETIKLSKGPLKDFSHAMEPYLRQLGLPTTLERGVVTLLKDYVVCKAGAVLTPEQAKILKLLDYKLATFKLNLRCCWVKGKGFEKFDEKEESEEENQEEDEQNNSDVEDVEMEETED